ncbi:hypothetical protein AAFF_G00426660 [Aldrovandia affinis]|uniref:C-type lectin domain-containing protein n=1 Tax=Aldrovandia affinis TaxID=143900 RepID=A0AAD7WIM9_9TELE|nr:hypothetical protein AAFF_G00426660 [Aldrovandia affinis]
MYGHHSEKGGRDYIHKCEEFNIKSTHSCTSRICDTRENSPGSVSLTLVCLVLLCVILLSAVIALFVYYNTRPMKTENNKLSAERKALNQTLAVRECKPCKNNWTLFNSKCYFLYKGNWWKSWNDSRKKCIHQGADLVIIESTEEQEFINKHALYYYDKWHGYWIGLTDVEGTRHWVNGTPLREGHWHPEFVKKPEDGCVLTFSSNNSLESWRFAKCDMVNRWICEANALIILD